MRANPIALNRWIGLLASLCLVITLVVSTGPVFSHSPLPERNLNEQGTSCSADNPGRVSVITGGGQASNFGNSDFPIMSNTGQWVVFMSSATNLVSGDTNTADDIFVHDRNTCTTTRESVATGGTQANGASRIAGISSNGQFVVIESFASNLVASDTNNAWDIFVRDRTGNTTSRVSVSTAGVQADAGSAYPVISNDGRYVAFQSSATNLVASDTNAFDDVFLRDRQTNTTTRISVASDGTQANGDSFTPSISSDGRYIAFESDATNLVADDTNNRRDIFLRDTQTNTTTRISIASGLTGVEGNGDSNSAVISGNGLFVAYVSAATNLVADDTNLRDDVFVRDIQNNATERVSVSSAPVTQANQSSSAPSISSSGRYVAFDSAASNLVLGDTNNRTDIFVHDRQNDTTTRISNSTTNQQGNNDSFNADISSGTGRFIAYASRASNLVNGDTNNAIDIFVWDTTPGAGTFLPPQDVTATPVARGQINLAWTDVSDETDFRIERSPNGTTNWVQIATVPANTTTYASTGLYCGTIYFYRLRGYRSTTDEFSQYSDTANATTLACPPQPDELVLFNSQFGWVSQVNSLADNPPLSAYTTYAAGAPVSGQWVTGDWDGDGQESPGVFSQGAFWYTNVIGQATSQWTGIWIGPLTGKPVAGRFINTVTNDCFGLVVDDIGLWWTCDLVTTAPAINGQWLGGQLTCIAGSNPLECLTGPYQFSAGDYDNDGVDTIVIRRERYISWTNIHTTTELALFLSGWAQFIGAPGPGGQYGILVTGDWNNDNFDSFGLVYDNGDFFRRNDLLWNSGVYFVQHAGTPVGTPLNAGAMRQ